MAKLLTQATPADRSEIDNLLKSLDLPVSDLPASLDNFMVAKETERITGICGLELFGRIALLRSLAVIPNQQSRGLGNLLYQAAMNLAKENGVTDVYLITTSATGFFAKLGFAIIER